MRPQHITAENLKIAFDHKFFTRASMRPQHITAENVALRARRLGRVRHASMRPQHITAENAVKTKSLPPANI